MRAMAFHGDTEFYKELLDPVKDTAILGPAADCSIVKKMSPAETGH